MKHFVIISIVFTTSLLLQNSTVRAQETKLPPKKASETEAADTPSAVAINEEKFTAIVQYSKGNTQYNFKDVILFDETIEVPKGSYLKVITQKRCVAVFYENTRVHTPANKTSPWEVINGSARWICPEQKIERVVYKDSELQVQNGELLLLNDELAVVRDSVLFNNRMLKPKTIYRYMNAKWLPLRNQPDPYFIWRKNRSFDPPIESSLHSLEKPHDPFVTRVFLNVAPIGMSGIYHHNWESQFSEHRMDTHAFRIGTSFPYKNKSWFVFLEHSKAEEDDHKGYFTPIGARHLSFEQTTLAVGLRHSHIKSTSSYYYVGFTRQELEYGMNTQFGGLDAEILYPYNLSVGGGYQKIFWPKSWISLMVGVDLKITQSLSQGKLRFFYQPWNSNENPRGAITQFSSFVYLGPVFNF